ncbi:hypothetical protein RDI58_011590 [Solanum bulbocastanum]|uniref:t-SNARE coiled-coil homology domain-containing protein n=1 Tax=Solanum bulbocastanum TaxID=147425 RepID=A0AAN8TRP3_SOLBU
MASSSHRGGDFYGAASYRSRDGLSTRQVGGADEIQLRIDPMHGDLDDEITGLRKQVKQLRNVSNDIDQSSGRSKEQHETVEQEYHPGRIKPCDACGSFCSILLLCNILVGQVFTEISVTLLSMLACCFLVQVLMKTQFIQVIEQILSSGRFLVIWEAMRATVGTPDISLM